MQTYLDVIGEVYESFDKGPAQPKFNLLKAVSAEIYVTGVTPYCMAEPDQTQISG